jgi:hypothetical protein
MLRTIGQLSAIAFLAFIAIAGFFVGFPSRIGSPGHDHYIIVPLLLALCSIVVAISAVAGRCEADDRRRILFLVSVLAGISVLASVLLGLAAHGVINIPPAHLLGPLLSLDGQYAFEAAEFEVYCELWLCAAAFVGAVIFAFWSSGNLLIKQGTLPD